MKIYVDAGHGGVDSGAVGNGIKEKDIVLTLAKRIEKQLSEYSDDRTKSLAQRTNEANSWGADLFLSLHCNAFNGKVSGYEDFIFSGLTKNAKTILYQQIMHEQITKKSGLRNRGMKRANFHVLRETNMPAILTENGFIDHAVDARKMLDSAWLHNVATGHVKGISLIFNLTKKDDNILYSVITGSFENHTNAKNRKNLLASHHLNSEIIPTNIQGKSLYRVQVGSFPNKTNARRQVERIKKAGIQAFISQSSK